MKSIAVAAAFALFLGASFPGSSQQGPFAPTGTQATQAELDQLLAPIALYPDALLGQVLAASTYPLEVVALQRWLARNPGLSGDALDQALAAQPWDESVKALAPFRSVVDMMNGELDWMQRVGNAFLASEADVMDAVQRLRGKARAAGSLDDNARERVVVDGDEVLIEPAEADVIYVPVYDPRVVYGPWWWPDYPPYAWSAVYFGPWDYVFGGIYFGFGVGVAHSWFDHAHPDWRHGNLLIRRPGAPTVWRHDPIHRGGVPYADPRTRDRFGGIDRDRVSGRQGFRGFDVRPTAPRTPPPNPATRVAPQPQPQGNRLARPAPQPANPLSRPAQRAPAGSSPLAPVPRDSASQQSARGHESLAPSRPAPSASSKPSRERR